MRMKLLLLFVQLLPGLSVLRAAQLVQHNINWKCCSCNGTCTPHLGSLLGPSPMMTIVVGFYCPREERSRMLFQMRSAVRHIRSPPLRRSALLFMLIRLPSFRCGCHKGIRRVTDCALCSWRGREEKWRNGTMRWPNIVSILQPA